MKEPLQKIIRYWKTGLSHGLGLSRSLAGPITVHIETTNICNFRCVYCPQSNPEDHFSILGRGKMSFDNFKIILNKILSAWPVKEVILTRDGEPLVHPQLAQFVDYASKAGLAVTIGSNGSYFTMDRVKTLMDNGLTKVKGDFCSDKTKYEQLRVGGKWEEVLNGYRNLLDYSSKNGNVFHLVLVDLAVYDLSNPDEIQNSLNDLRALFPYHDKYISIGPAMMHNALQEAKIILSSSNRLKKKKYNLCHHPWIELVIDYRGNAVGCCRDLRSEYVLGNVLESKDIVKDLWNGERMQHLRRQLASKKPESISTCSKCDLPYGISYAGQTLLKKYIRFLKR
jgi:radical SAM protein with 4Fe4S-binding SPASM domain